MDFIASPHHSLQKAGMLTEPAPQSSYEIGGYETFTTAVTADLGQGDNS